MKTGQLPRLRHSVASLALLQASNFLVPLITWPYLTRVLGPEAFGQIMFVQALMAAATVVTDYAFSWSATRDVSAARGDRSSLSRIFLSTWGAQWLLCAAVSMLIAAALSARVHMPAPATLVVIGLPILIGNTLFPLWLFQGLERMAEMAWIQIGMRVATVPLLLFLVDAADDAPIALAIQSGALLSAGALAVAWLVRSGLVDWQRPTLAECANALRSGLSLFGSKVAIACYTSLVPIILGFAAGPVAVGYFALADRIRAAGQSMITPLSQALFPRLSLLFATDSANARALVRLALLWMIGCGALVGIVMFSGAALAVRLLGGAGFEPATQVLRLISAVPLIVGLSNVFGVQVMLPNGMTASFTRILWLAAVVGLVLVWPLASAAGANGAGLTVLGVESLVTTAMLFVLLRHPTIWLKK